MGGLSDVMRLGVAVSLASVLLLVGPLAVAQSTTAGVRSTLSVEVGEDRAESMSLRFEGLRRLTEYQDICLPIGATLQGVRDELGAVPHTAKAGEDGRVSVTFRARAEVTTLTMRRAGASDEHAPFFEADANFCVPEGSRTTVRVLVPEGYEVFFFSRGGVIEPGGREASLTRQGPVHVFYSYQAPLDAASGLVAVDAAPFHVVAPAARAEQAREVAGVAAPALDAALREAGLDLPWDRLRVRYAPSTEFSWEAGHYGGHGLITIRQASLDPDPREGYPHVAARVLVHEAFHAVSAPNGRGPVTETVDWWLEGTARHAERHVTLLSPNSTRHCEKNLREVRCWSFDDRVSKDELDQAYEAGFTFERRWSPSLEQPSGTRSFYYRLSAFLVGAYVQQYGQDAYRDAWGRVTRAFEEGAGCPCGDGWLERTLLDAAGGEVPARDLYTPRAAQRFAEPAAFEAWARPLVKDEKALQDELDRAAGDPREILTPGPGAATLLGASVVALAFVALRRGRPRAR